MKSCLPLIAALVCLSPPPAWAASCGLTATVRHNSKHDGPRWIYTDKDSLFFTSSMAVNTDGAPTSYHPDDPGGTTKAINTICNGANVILASGQKLNYSQCGKLIAAFKSAKDKGFDPDQKPRVDFYAVATEKGRPCTIPSGPYAGYFVSTTSQVADDKLGVCEQGRYLDALSLPFVIYPRHKNFTGAGVGTGDVAVSYDPKTGTLEYGIVGDQGPAWGLAEGSVFLTKTLRGLTKDPENRKQTYGYGVPKAHTLLLPKASIAPPYTLAKIREEGRKAFEAWGGRARFDDCVASAGKKP